MNAVRTRETTRLHPRCFVVALVPSQSRGGQHDLLVLPSKPAIRVSKTEVKIQSRRLGVVSTEPKEVVLHLARDVDLIDEAVVDAMAARLAGRRCRH